MVSALLRTRTNSRKRREALHTVLGRRLFAALAIATLTTSTVLFGHHPVARAQGTYCPSTGGFVMGYAGELYSGSAVLSGANTYSFIAGNIGGTSLIMGEFYVSDASCASAEGGIVLVNGSDIQVNYAGPNQGDWPPAPPGTYYGSRATPNTGTLFALVQFTPWAERNGS
jgi:hypothetical protein